jgi:hypothetical protein
MAKAASVADVILEWSRASRPKALTAESPEHMALFATPPAPEDQRVTDPAKGFSKEKTPFPFLKRAFGASRRPLLML